MSLTRLHVAGSYGEKSVIEVDADKARYLGRVLRLRAGDNLLIFDGDGSEYSAVIDAIGRSSAAIRVNENRNTQTESRLRLHLVQGISRGERMDFVVQKATELGVKRITPVLTEFGVVKLDATRAEKRREHWHKVAVSACEQSGRVKLPLIDTPIPLKNWFAEKPRQVDAEIILKPGAATPMTAIESPSTKVCLLVGPEGGFSAGEFEDADIAGFQPVSLGPRVLRTETAAIAAIATLQTLWGDFR